MKSPKPAQHALPHDTTYTLVSTFHTGGIANGVGCQNCGKLLTNVAVVQAAEGHQYQVGLDCAATLASVNPFEFDAAADGFNQGKQVRAALLKWRKQYADECQLEVYATDEPATEISINALRVTEDGTKRDRLFSKWVPVGVYAAIIQPMSSELLPKQPQSQAEQLAEQEARRVAYEAKHGTLKEQLAAVRQTLIKS